MKSSDPSPTPPTGSPSEPEPERPEQRDSAWLRSVEEKQSRKLAARAQGPPRAWFGLGVFGLVGWSIAVPTLSGIALGLWLDRRWPGRYSWTLMLLFAGLAVGCWQVWYWLAREGRVD